MLYDLTGCPFPVSVGIKGAFFGVAKPNPLRSIVGCSNPEVLPALKVSEVLLLGPEETVQSLLHRSRLNVRQISVLSLTAILSVPERRRIS